MHTPVAPDSLTAIALDAIVTGLERVERESRKIEAERIRLLSEALELAAIEGETPRNVGAERSEPHLPSGSRGELALRAIRAEIATALHLSERTVDRQLSQAYSIASAFPAVLAEMTVGDVSPRHAAAIVQAGAVIGAGVDAESVIGRGAYAEAVILEATDRTPAGLAVQAKRIAERFAAQPLEDRHVEARRQRCVWVEDREDGMADLFAHLPATEAYAIKARLTQAARAVAESERTAARAQTPGAARDCTHDAADSGPDPDPPPALAPGPGTAPRCLDEIRADLLAGLLLNGVLNRGPAGVPNGGPGCGSDYGPDFGPNGVPGCGPDTGEDQLAALSGVRASVQLVVPIASVPDLVGAFTLENLPAPSESPELVGYGPIDTQSTRRLMGDAPTWDLVRSSPESGEILSVDRYRPSEQMRRLLRARDQRCRFPGCRMPAARCDLDHTIDAARGGKTTTSNLAHLCRGHHTLKHQTGWRVEQGGAGELTWSSPTGRRHTTRPDRPPGGTAGLAPAAGLPG